MDETKAAIYVACPTGEVSDGYHTFDELYEHRHALFLALVRQNKAMAWRARMDSEGKGMEGWFLVGLRLPGGDISYHLPDRLWENLEGIQTTEKAPKWDGHTSADVVKRLLQWKPNV